MEAKNREELLKTYDEVSSFSEGLAWIRKDEKGFHIRPDGKRVKE